MTFSPTVLDVLAGKRFGLVSFDTSEARTILSILKEIHAFGRTINLAQIAAEPWLLNAFDICVCEVSQLGPGKPHGIPYTDGWSIQRRKHRIERPFPRTGRDAKCRRCDRLLLHGSRNKNNRSGSS
jgi:hypothetical protein